MAASDAGTRCAR